MRPPIKSLVTTTPPRAAARPSAARPTDPRLRPTPSLNLPPYFLFPTDTHSPQHHSTCPSHSANLRLLIYIIYLYLSHRHDCGRVHRTTQVAQLPGSQPRFEQGFEGRGRSYHGGGERSRHKLGNDQGVLPGPHRGMAKVPTTQSYRIGATKGKRIRGAAGLWSSLVDRDGVWCEASRPPWSPRARSQKRGQQLLSLSPSVHVANRP